MSITNTVKPLKKRSMIDVTQFLPTYNNYMFVSQISDLSNTNDNVARFIILYDLNISHKNKIISITAEIMHIDTVNKKNISNKYNSILSEWIYNNNQKVIVRDFSNGNMIINDEYIDPIFRVQDVFYPDIKTCKYKTMQSFDYYSSAIKENGLNNDLFSFIVTVCDEIDDLFDHYEPLTKYLLMQPKEVNLNLINTGRGGTTSKNQTLILK